MVLGCESLRKSLNGSVNDRVELAKSSIPDECGCEIFLKLSKDSSNEVRTAVANNVKLPTKCACRVMGRLSVDEVTEFLNLGKIVSFS